MVAVKSGKFEIFLYLTEIGADINRRDDDNNTALHLAAESGSPDIINLLLDIGMSVNLTNKNDSTPLHVSAEFGHLDATKALFERGATTNYINKYGNTPHMVALKSDKFEICRYFTKIGADINIHDDDNNTALHSADESVSVVIHAANRKKALHYAVLSCSVDIIYLLLDKGMSVNLTDTDESTPLHVSLEFGHLNATKISVLNGAAINYPNNDFRTPLMLVAYCDELEILRYLSEIGKR
jgi:ankyrin repeat protein